MEKVRLDANETKILGTPSAFFQSPICFFSSLRKMILSRWYSCINEQSLFLNVEQGPRATSGSEYKMFLIDKHSWAINLFKAAEKSTQNNLCGIKQGFFPS
jgi:hypothetical protein